MDWPPPSLHTHRTNFLQRKSSSSTLGYTMNLGDGVGSLYIFTGTVEFAPRIGHLDTSLFHTVYDHCNTIVYSSIVLWYYHPKHRSCRNEIPYLHHGEPTMKGPLPNYLYAR